MIWVISQLLWPVWQINCLDRPRTQKKKKIKRTWESPKDFLEFIHVIGVNPSGCTGESKVLNDMVYELQKYDM